MSKTFKSAHGKGTELFVSAMSSGAIQFVIRDKGADIGKAGIYVPQEDGAKIALAVLEAAGFKAAFHATGTFRDGDCWQLENVAQVIKDYLSIKDAEAAAVREQAKLEAEAFNLYRAYMAVHEPMNAIGGWHMLSEHTKETWLAVARKARELGERAEK